MKIEMLAITDHRHASNAEAAQFDQEAAQPIRIRVKWTSLGIYILINHSLKV